MRRVVAGVPRSPAAGLHLPGAGAATPAGAADTSERGVAAAPPGRGATWLVPAGAAALAALLAAGGAAAVYRRRAPGGPAV